jgi:hypothetical protein
VYGGVIGLDEKASRPATENVFMYCSVILVEIVDRR